MSRSESRPAALGCLLVAALAAACGTAVSEAPVADTATFRPDGLEAVRQQVRDDIAAGEIAGAVVLLDQRGETVMFESFGNRELETGAPMTEDTLFRIYSMTKPITSVATMILAEQGALDLDDPVHRYLPELEALQVGIVEDADGEEPTIRRVPVERPMTVRDLLRHTSGLTYGIFDDSPVDRLVLRARALGAPTLAEMVTRLSTVPLKHQPGARFEYSVSTDVLARVVEVASGQRFSDFLQERIFAPLAMLDTAFWAPEDKQDRLAGYYNGDGEALTRVQERGGYLAPPTFESGGGGLVSTAADYLRFCRMILGGGELDGARILSAGSIEEMATDQLPSAREGGAETPRGFGFGFGFQVAIEQPEDGDGSIGELSWGGIASTGFWIDPIEQIIGIYMIQRQPFSPQYSARFHELVYAALERPGTRP